MTLPSTFPRLRWAAAWASILFAVLTSSASAQYADAVQILGTAGVHRVHAIEPGLDGRFVYVAADELSDAPTTLTQFDRDPLSGDLTFVDRYFDGVGGMLGIGSLRDLKSSEAGETLFAVGGDEQRLEATVLALGTNGRLSVVDSFEIENAPPVGETWIETGADDRSIYLVDSSADGTTTLLVALTLSRERTLRESQRIELAGQGRGLAVSPDGRHVYVATLSSAEGGSTLLHIFEIVGGRLVARDPFEAAGMPRLANLDELLVSLDGSHLYATFAQPRTPLMEPTSGFVAFRRHLSTGRLTEPILVSSPDPLPTGHQGTKTVLAPDDRFAFQCGPSGAVHVFETDLFQRSFEEIELFYPPLTHELDCRALAVATDGRHLYGEAIGTVGIFEVDAATGELATAGRVTNAEGGVPAALSPHDITVIDDLAYVARDDGEIAIFRRDLSDGGRLSLVTTVSLTDYGLNPPWDVSRFLVSDDKRFIYASGTGLGIAVFERDDSNGMLQLLGQAHPVRSYALMALAKDGRTLYATASSGAFIETFSRNPATGELTFLQLEGFSPYSRATDLVASADGRHLYAVLDDSPFRDPVLAVFRRDRTDGKLEHLPQEQEPLPTECTTGSAAGTLHLSSDDRFLYVGSGYVPVFRRGVTGDALTYETCASVPGVIEAATPDGLAYFGKSGFRPDEYRLHVYLKRPGKAGLDAVQTLRYGYRSGALRAAPDGRNVFVLNRFGGITVIDLPYQSSPAFPDFVFSAQTRDRLGRRVAVGRPVADCLPETLCLSGAVPGRAELLLRIVGPKPNGHLWPNLITFSTSTVELVVRQISTGVERTYTLDAPAPGLDLLQGLFDRTAFEPALGGTSLRKTSFTGETGLGEAPEPPPGSGPYVSDELPGFRFWVKISTAAGTPLPSRPEVDCLAETTCFSGSLTGRSEVFARLVGPKPNGYLWPTIARFTTSSVEVWIEQIATGTSRYYQLDAAAPGVDELDGLFDREGFLP